VLAVSFLTLDLRPGLVVALAISLVLAMTFAALEYLGISLQRISLGALIIALGLLVMRRAESARSSIPVPPPANFLPLIFVQTSHAAISTILANFKAG
jgi:hypothetical protein